MYVGSPWCRDFVSECSSGILLNGRGTGGVSTGGESNFPNTIDGCNDGDAGTNSDRDESLEKIVVRSGDLSGNGADVEIQEGSMITITATVWANPEEFQSDYADFFYTSDFGLFPNWQLIHTERATQGKTNELRTTFTLPLGGSSYQAVRVQFRNGGTNSNACAGGRQNDRDDLAFKVQKSNIVSLFCSHHERNQF